MKNGRSGGMEDMDDTLTVLQHGVGGTMRLRKEFQSSLALTWTTFECYHTVANV